MLFFCGVTLGQTLPKISPSPAKTDPEMKNWEICIQQMRELKTALVNFNNDIGKFPRLIEENALSKLKIKLLSGAKSFQNSLINIGYTSLSAYQINIDPPQHFPESYFAADLPMLGTQTNVLYTPCHEITTYFMDPRVYLLRWKGPYIKGKPPEIFMTDPWGTKIRYEVFGDTLYLHSAGSDKKFESMADCIVSLTLDDVYLSVSRLKF